MSLVPFDDRDGFIWYDGRLVPWRHAKLHVVPTSNYPQFRLRVHRRP
jgi:hypothetical protein